MPHRLGTEQEPTAPEPGEIAAQIATTGYFPVTVGLDRHFLDGLYGDFDDVAKMAAADPDIAAAFRTPSRTPDDPPRTANQIGSLEHRERVVVDGVTVDLVNGVPAQLPPGTTNKSIYLHNRDTAAQVQGVLPRAKFAGPVQRLVKGAEEVWDAFTEYTSPLLGALGLRGYFFGSREDERHRVKLINYRDESALAPRLPSNEAPLASLHTDYNRFTVAVDNTEPGLVGAPFDIDRIRSSLVEEDASPNARPRTAEEMLDAVAQRALSTQISPPDGTSAFFVGGGYSLMPDELKRISHRLPPLLHGVTDTGHGRDRYALIVFMNELAGNDWPLPTTKDCELIEIRDALQGGT